MAVQNVQSQISKYWEQNILITGLSVVVGAVAGGLIRGCEGAVFIGALGGVGYLLIIYSQGQLAKYEADLYRHNLAVFDINIPVLADIPNHKN